MKYEHIYCLLGKIILPGRFFAVFPELLDRRRKPLAGLLVERSVKKCRRYKIHSTKKMVHLVIVKQYIFRGKMGCSLFWKSYLGQTCLASTAAAYSWPKLRSVMATSSKMMLKSRARSVNWKHKSIVSLRREI